MMKLTTTRLYAGPFAKPLAGAILALTAFASQAADVPSPDVIRFEIKGFNVSGNSLLPQAQVDAALAPFTGKDRDFGHVQRALEALEAVYHKIGYKVVQVELPEQELNQGTVKLKVVEVKIGKVLVSGNTVFDEANIRHSLPGLREGETPDLNRISASLKLANENPAKKVTLQLESGDKDNEVNASLKVIDQKVWNIALNLDNTGNAATGKTHAGLVFQHANVAGLDHVASLQYTTTLEKPSNVSVYGAGYHIPLYSLGGSLDLYGSYSNVDSGTVAAGVFNLQVSGKGAVYGFRYNHSLGRFGTYEPKVSFGLDHKAFINSVELSGTQLGKDVTVHPLTVGYTGSWTLDGSDVGVSLNLSRNIPGGKRGSSADFNGVRVGAKPGYTILRYGANLSRVLAGDWQMRLGLAGQYTRDALIPGEQFGVGGGSSVRGFTEREVSNDYGYQLNAEIYTPNLCDKLGGGAAQCRLVGFADAARALRNHALAGETESTTLGSVGVGLRVMVDRHLSMQVDYGHVLNTGGIADKDKNRLHVRVGLSY